MINLDPHLAVYFLTFVILILLIALIPQVMSSFMAFAGNFEIYARSLQGLLRQLESAAAEQDAPARRGDTPKLSSPPAASEGTRVSRAHAMAASQPGRVR